MPNKSARGRTERSEASRAREVTLEELDVDDADVLRHVALYADLKEVLRRARYPFVVLPAAYASRWDRALFLNLTYWGASEGRDVLPDARITGDVVAHVAWHHLAAKAVGSSSVEALLLGESIASAFDLYLVGRLLGRKGRSSFLETQVPAMASAASAAGLPARGFEALLAAVAADPERAFSDLRVLLYDAALALYDCKTTGDAQAAFAPFDAHRFGPLLHHYELSNWLLFSRAHAGSHARKGSAPLEVDRALRDAKVPLDWLVTEWVAPALA
jgi:hypothetical protein